MAEHHTQFFKVGIRQLGQDLSVDRVIAKNLLVLPQPETSQPSGNVHNSSPRAELALRLMLAQTNGKCFWFGRPISTGSTVA